MIRACLLSGLLSNSYRHLSAIDGSKIERDIKADNHIAKRIPVK